MSARIGKRHNAFGSVVVMAALDSKDRIGRRKLNDLPIVSEVSIAPKRPTAEIPLYVEILKAPFTEMRCRGPGECGPA